MKRFLRNIALLSIPLIIYLIIIVLVDPFNYLNISGLVDDSIKSVISRDVAPHMYKLIDFDNNPRKNITIGDSRTNSLVESLDQEQWANLAFRGGTLKEMVQVFWWAVDKHEIDTVLLGINLNLYNKYNKRFYVEQTIEAQKNFFSYAFNKNIFRSTYLILRSYLSKEETDLNESESGREEISINETTFNKEEFWEYQLTVTPEKFYKQLAYPDGYYHDLKDISIYCHENNIKLIIWIPPTHVDFQNRISQYNLDEANAVFLNDLKSLADVYDYNYQNELTMNKDFFRDPLHFTQDIAVLIRDELLQGKKYLAKRSELVSKP